MFNNLPSTCLREKTRISEIQIVLFNIANGRAPRRVVPHFHNIPHSLQPPIVISTTGGSKQPPVVLEKNCNGCF